MNAFITVTFVEGRVTSLVDNEQGYVMFGKWRYSINSLVYQARIDSGRCNWWIDHLR